MTMRDDSKESTRAIILLAISGVSLIFATSMFAFQEPILVALSILVYLIVSMHTWRLVYRIQLHALKDHLTGASNLRAWQDALRRALSHGCRHNWPFCVAIIDIDHFKGVNDQYGHQGGDYVLKETAKVFMAQLRDIDTFARCGGDEFTALLTNCDQARAQEVVDRLRSRMPPGITFSAGVAEWDGCETADQLMKRADRGLYQAKHRGRDQVVAYT